MSSYRSVNLPLCLRHTAGTGSQVHWPESSDIKLNHEAQYQPRPVRWPEVNLQLPPGLSAWDSSAWGHRTPPPSPCARTAALCGEKEKEEMRISQSQVSKANPKSGLRQKSLAGVKRASVTTRLLLWLICVGLRICGVTASMSPFWNGEAHMCNPFVNLKMYYIN